MASPAEEFAHFYQIWEKGLNDALAAAARDVSKRVAVAAGGGAGQAVSASQASAVRAAARNALHPAYDDIGRMLASGRINAAGLAGRVAAEMDASLLEQVFDADTVERFIVSESYRAAAGIEAAARRVSGETQIPLSQQVYRTNALSQGWVDRAINVGLAQGLSAAQLARKVRGMIDPNTPGGVSYASKRLARTEINNAFHASAVARMASKPWVEAVRWHLSGSHSDPDICNEYAQNDNEGLGEGLWPPGKVPAKPHPQCLCYVTAELPSPDQFVQNYLNGNYDAWLDSEFPELAASKANFAGNFAISKNPEVRRRVDNFTPEQRKRWMNDRRSVEKKLSDPRYNIDGTVAPVPKTTPPVPKEKIVPDTTTTIRGKLRQFIDPNRDMDPRDFASIYVNSGPKGRFFISNLGDAKEATRVAAHFRSLGYRSTASHDTVFLYPRIPDVIKAPVFRNSKLLKENPPEVTTNVSNARVQYEKLANEFPGAYSPDAKLVLTEGGAGRKADDIGRSIADYNSGLERMRFNVAAFDNDGMESWSRSRSKGWLSHAGEGWEDAPSAVASHEYGHLLDFSLDYEARQRMRDGIVRELGIPLRQTGLGAPAREMTAAEALGSPGARNIITTKVSKYASTDEWELVAELFAEAAYDYQAASPAAKFVWDTFKKELGSR